MPVDTSPSASVEAEEIEGAPVGETPKTTSIPLYGMRFSSRTLYLSGLGTSAPATPYNRFGCPLSNESPVTAARTFRRVTASSYPDSDVCAFRFVMPAVSPLMSNSTATDPAGIVTVAGTVAIALSNVRETVRSVSRASGNLDPGSPCGT